VTAHQLADPGHPVHDDRLDRTGGTFDPTAFDVAAVNGARQHIR
jgi:hypothetical protein